MAKVESKLPTISLETSRNPYMYITCFCKLREERAGEEYWRRQQLERPDCSMDTPYWNTWARLPAGIACKPHECCCPSHCWDQDSIDAPRLCIWFHDSADLKAGMDERVQLSRRLVVDVSAHSVFRYHNVPRISDDKNRSVGSTRAETCRQRSISCSRVSLAVTTTVDERKVAKVGLQ